MHNVLIDPIPESKIIKVESINAETKLLKNESVIYHFLNGTQGIPSVKWFGKDDINYYMVINLLGNSLQSIKEKLITFSLKLVLQIGIKIISLLKTIHDKGLVHRDIKPDNFLLSINNENKDIYLIDFGFCKSYMIDNKHIEERRINNLIGSKIEGAYIQRFSAKYDPASIKNIFEIKSLKKLDRISKNVKYLPPKVRQKINYINKL